MARGITRRGLLVRSGRPLLAGGAVALVPRGPASASASKPAGRNAAPPEPTPAPGVNVAGFGVGPDRLLLLVSQREFYGAAEYTVFVDGRRADTDGLSVSAAADQSGKSDFVTVRGAWGAGGPSSVRLSFSNDLNVYSADPGRDRSLRNLYLDAIYYNGAKSNTPRTWCHDSPDIPLSLPPRAPPIAPGLNENAPDRRPPSGGTRGRVGVMLQGQSNAILFHEDAAFSHFLPALEGLTGLRGQIEYSGEWTAGARGGARNMASGTATYGFPGSDEDWLNPAVGSRGDPSTWGDAEHMRGLKAYVARRSGAVGADRPWLLVRMHQEYDGTHTAPENAAYEMANREFVRRWRSGFDRPDRLLPAFMTPVSFRMRVRDDALRAIRRGWHRQAQDASHHAYHGVGSTNDALDRGDGSHGTPESLRRIGLRLAVRLAKWLWRAGYSADDLAWLPTLGPRVTGARRVPGDRRALDVLVTHDKGTDLIVPAGVAVDDWVVEDCGKRHAVTGIARVGAATLRLSLDADLIGWGEEITVDFGRAPSFGGPDGQVSDDWHRMMPTRAGGVRGLSDVRMILCRTFSPITVRDA